MANLADIKVGSREIEIKHPATDDNIGIRVELISLDDPAMKGIKRKLIDERSRREQRGKILKAEELEENQHMTLFAAMKGWTWYNPTGEEGDKDFDPDAMPDFNGEIPDFNRKNVYAIFDKLSWFADQVNKEIMDEKAFFTIAKTN